MNSKTVLLVASAGLGAWLLSRNIRRGKYDFRNKVVVITGGSRGLGLELSRQLALEGARLALCARDGEELERAKVELAKVTILFTQVCDVTVPEQVREFAAQVAQRFGPADVLINNAGKIIVGPMAAMTRQDFEDALAVNFWGAYHTVEAFLPGMRSKGSGKIVNISSVGGKISVPHLLPYSVSKFALVGYSQGLRAELAADGIDVTAVCPGLMRTGSPRNAEFKGDHQAEYAWFSIADSLPLLTISSEKAAKQIVEACRRGDGEVILSLPAKVAVQLQALFPDLIDDLLALAQRLLPSSENGSKEPQPGSESTSWAAPSFLTRLTEYAANKNNEVPAS